jgi:predicted DNA-binding transcriptional regulator AlpA
MEKLLTKEEFARELQMSTATLDRRRKEWQFRVVRVGQIRFPESEVERFIRAHTGNDPIRRQGA